MDEIDAYGAARSDSILTSANVSVMLIALHLLQDRCIPLDSQRKAVLFFNHAKLDRNQRKATSSAHVDLGASCMDDSGPQASSNDNVACDHETLTEDSVLYEGEHLIIRSKTPTSLKPKTLIAIRHCEPKYNGVPFPNPMSGQYLMAASIYILQLFLVYLVELSARQAIPSGFLKRSLAAVDLAVPMTVITGSTMIFVTDITSLKENGTDTSRTARTLVLPAFGVIVPVGMACLLYGFVTSA